MPKNKGGKYHGGVASLFIFFLLFFALASVLKAQNTTSDSIYLSELQEKALRMQLHTDRYWHILMHYEPTFRGFVSRIDDEGFFLAKDGKTNPQAELQATIAAFFDDPANNGETPAACRFAARFEWLKEKLNIDTSRLPVDVCESFEMFIQQVKPESVTLIFPTAYLNSPASMFGHTLLTIETANKSKLLAYAVSYSAQTNETFGPLFAIKGLAGFYSGYFSIMPYYAKLQEYTDMDRRDIWEYQLNLTKPEMRRMMLHIRELHEVASDYYFFDENCSYALYYLLEAARPSIHLTDKSPYWLIPLDSIRTIKNAGFITGVTYRPSRTTQILNMAATLDKKAQKDAIELATLADPLNRLSVNETEREPAVQARMYDLASDYLQYLFIKKIVPKDIYQQRFLHLLQKRSKLGQTQQDEALKAPVPTHPDKGHRSCRLALGGGIQDDNYFTELRLRPAYHGLMDNDSGYVKGAQLFFSDLALRYYPQKNSVKLEALDMIDLISLSPRNLFFHPISWKLKTGLTRFYQRDDTNRLVYELNPGAGFCWETSWGGLFYTFFETNLNISGALEHNNALGAGGTSGALLSITKSWKMHIYGRDIYYSLGETGSNFEAGIQQSLFLSQNQSISFDFARRASRRTYQSEAKLLWNYFF